MIGTAVEKGREKIALMAEADGMVLFAREVRAGAWDHRRDVSSAIKDFRERAKADAP